jgi:hypothetical protein
LLECSQSSLPRRTTDQLGIVCSILFEASKL